MEDWYMQILRVWDLLPLVDIPKLAKHLDTVFGSYTYDFLSFCKVKCLEGDLEVPMHWETSRDIICQRETGFQEDVKVSKSFFLMKFYSLSSGMVSHLLSGCDGREQELPFELTSQEMEIICFDKSSFILGRSGIGKAIVLVRNLFQKEQLYHIASEGFRQPNCFTSKNIRSEDMKEAKEIFLRQIFVTLNPRLCYAIKQNVSSLKRKKNGKRIHGKHTCPGSGSMSSSSGAQGDGKTIKECKDMIRRRLQTPMVKFLLDHLEKSGCGIGRTFRDDICRLYRLS